MANASLTTLSLLIASVLTGCLVAGQITTQECTSNFDGITINGKCFFVKANDSSWSDAWTICAEDCATLAQIHATNEFEAIKSLLERNGRNPNATGYIRAWIALQREPSTSGECSATPNTTFWYDGPNAKNPNMPAGNTWVQSHLCDDQDFGDEYFLSLMMNDNWWLGVADLPADGDGHPSFPLCQISIRGNRYSKNTNDKCMKETPIESTPVDGFQSCAEMCVSKSWCRSFDVIISTGTCNLFTWISSDTAKPKLQTGGCDCAHYDTDP